MDAWMNETFKIQLPRILRECKRIKTSTQNEQSRQLYIYKWGKEEPLPQPSMFSSELYRPKSQPDSTWFLLTVLLPLRHRSDDLIHMKLSLHRIKFITYEYLSPDLVASFSARDLWNSKHSGPILPVVVKTNGVKVPCSICITRWLYSLFFASSCFLSMDGMEELT